MKLSETHPREALAEWARRGSVSSFSGPHRIAYYGDVMIITLKGKYTVKAQINLFGWRIRLWNRSGNINESVALLPDDAWLFVVPGPFDVRVDNLPGNLSATLIIDGTPIELFTYSTPLPNPVVEVPIVREWSGNRISAVLRVEA